MKKSIRFRRGLGAAGLLIFFCSGCTRHAREARLSARADREFQAGRIDAAEIDSLNALRLDRTDPSAIARLGIIYFDQGRIGKCLPFLLEGQKLLPDSRDVRLKLGLYFLAVGEFRKARDEAVFILDRNPRDRDAPLLLAEAAVQPTEIEEARRRLEQLPGTASGSAPVLVALGTLEFRERHFPAAADRFNQALKLDPKSSDAFTALGALAWEQNDARAADRVFARAAALAGDHPEKRLQYAEFKVQSGDRNAARGMLEDLIQKRPDFLPAELLLAEIDETEKKYAASAALDAKVLERDPTHPDALLLLGRLKLAEGKPEEAAAVLEKAEKNYPHSPKLEYELAQADFATGAPEKAADRLRRAVAWDPDFSAAVLYLSAIDLRMGNPGAAIARLKPFVQRHPDQASAGFLLAGADAAQGSFDDALAVCQQLAAAHPRDPSPLVDEGMILVRQNRSDEARRDFTRALALAPDELPALTQLTNLDLNEKRYAEARQRVESRIARDPAPPEPHLLLARVFVAQQDWGRAEASTREAMRLDPGASAGYFLLAQIDFETGRDGKALADLRVVTAKNPGDVPALRLIAQIEEREKDYPAVRDADEAILAVDPNSGSTLNDLAYLDAGRLGRLDEALALAQRARAALPHEPHVADTLGWILYLKHKYTWALTLLEEGAGGLPDEPEVQFHLGLARAMAGDEAGARAALQRAVRLGGSFPGRDQAAQQLDLLAIDPGTGGPAARALLEKALADRPDDPLVLSRLAAMEERAGEGDKAGVAWEAALRADPNLESALLGLARLEAARGDPAKAFALAKAARRAAPDDPAAALTLGQLAYRTGDYRWSVSLLEEAADGRPDDPEAQFDLARADYSVGRVAEAKAAMRRALAAPPPFSRSAEAATFLALVEDEEHPAPAEAGRAEKVLAADPGDAPALMVMAAIAAQGGRPDDAKRFYAGVLGRYPDFSPAQKKFVILCAENPGDDRRALDLAAKAQEAFPDDPQLAKAAGIVAYRQGDYPRAVDLLQESAGQDGGDGELTFYLGMAQYRLKDKAGKETLERAIGLHLRPDLAAEARQAVAEFTAAR